MGNLGNINFSEYDENAGFDPLPAGWYYCVVADSEEGESKAGNYMIKFTYEVVGPTHTGRNLWDYFVLEGEAKNLAISIGRLKGLAQKCGHPNPNKFNDSEELHGKEFWVKVKVTPAKDNYDEGNKVTSYRHKDDPPKGHSVPGSTKAPGSPPPPPDTPTKAEKPAATRPWEA